jgi:hypothetical protein
LEEKKCSGGEVVASGEHHSDATTGQKGVSGTRGVDIIRNGDHHRSGVPGGSFYLTLASDYGASFYDSTSVSAMPRWANADIFSDSRSCVGS